MNPWARRSAIVKYGTLWFLSACTSLTTVDLLSEETGSSSSGGARATSGGRSSGGTSATSGGASSGGRTTAMGGSQTTTGTANTTAPSSIPNLPKELIHLYDFEGTGTEIVDRVGGLSGVVLNGALLDGTGKLTINDGVSYVRLPSWLIKNAQSPSLTIATWVTWHGGASWSRVFDFGATNEGTDQPGSALSQFYFTPKFEPAKYYSVLFDSDANHDGQATIEGTQVFEVDQLTLVVVTIEGDETLGTSTLRLYINGAEGGPPSTVGQRLTEFTDQNCWLGQSQWIQDSSISQHFNGSYEEFRIYSRALSADEVSRLSLSDPTVL
jgi:hypothetical protein